MSFTVCLDRSNAFGNNRRSEVISVTIATSMAISVPFPIAMLTSASANACESLMPSPTIATVFPCNCNSRIKSSLSSGNASDTKRSIHNPAATARAVRCPSPVSMQMSIPCRLSSFTASAEVDLTGSVTAMIANS